MTGMNLHDYLSGSGRGAAAAVARSLSIHPVMISQWAANLKAVPAARCPDIERATDGAVTCEAMRPNARWVRVPDASWPHPKGRPLLDVAATAQA